MDDEGKADTGLAVHKEPTAINEQAARAMFDLPEDDPNLFSDQAKQRIRADAETEADHPEMGRPVASENGLTVGSRPDDAQTQQWAREGIPPMTESRPALRARIGRAAPPSLAIPQSRVNCPHCEGRGFVPGINDQLRESAAMLTSGGPKATDAVIRDFYIALFRNAPSLIAIFPGNPAQGDFGSDHRGAKQRELLLGALAGLADLYDPGDAERMTHLDSVLKRFGRSHAAFTRPDGTVSGATLDEYKAVKDALFSTLVRAAGDRWRAEYTVAWNQAYDYAAASMLLEQHRSGFVAPRFTRG